MRKISILTALLLLFSCIFIFSSCDNDNKNITTYNINCSINDNILTGTENVSFYNNTDNSFNNVKFNLFQNAYRKDAKYFAINDVHFSSAFYDKINYGQIKILEVNVENEKANFEISGVDNNILLVPLKNELFPNESTNIEIYFEVTIAKVNGRCGITKNTINLGNFYPIVCGIEDGSFYECVYYNNGDPFFSDVSNYTFTISIDENYIVASCGSEINRQKENDKNIITFKADKVRSFNLTLSKNFKVKSENCLNVKLNYYFYKDDGNVDYYMSTMVKALKTFTSLFGEYPYKELSVVQTGFYQGGMEFPMIVYISDSLKKEEFNEVIVHEMAHQWWQGVVGVNEIKYSYLDEGLSEYSTILFFENNSEYNMKKSDLIKQSEDTYKMYCSIYDKLYKNVDTSMNRTLDKFGSEYEYVCLSYMKSTIMFDTLRNTIGDNLFFKGLKIFYKTYAFKNATIYDLIGVFEKSGSDVNGFFQSFLDGKVII